jgi:CBS domain-containing protein
LFWINVTLAAFNLLPAFPMDGGRVLRALLAARIGRARATRLAGVVGKVLAVVFVLAGLTIGGTMLAIIGLFVWFAAEQESAVVTLTTMLANVTAADAMVREPRVVDAETSVDAVADQMLTGGIRELAVIEDGRVRGFVTATDLAPRISARPPHGTVGSAMHRDVPVVAPTTPLEALLEPLERHGVVFVGDRDAIVGVLTADQLAIFTTLHPSG